MYWTTIYTDGSYSLKHHIGCFGYVDTLNKLYYISPLYHNTTSQWMEALAFYHAILYIKKMYPNRKTLICTDSWYLYMSYTSWMSKWFNVSDGCLLMNKKLSHPTIWKKIFFIKMKWLQNQLDVQWVKAHATDKWNLFIDEKIQRKVQSYCK